MAKKPVELQAGNAGKPPVRKGPEPERLKLKSDDWEANVDAALKVKRPPQGWPKK